MAYTYPERSRTSSRQGERTYTVGSLTRAIKNVLEPAFSDVVVEGEISNFTHHRSGHRYWTLKDAEASISSVFWKTRVANFTIKDGMKVVCRGRLSLYAPRGSYQLDVYQIRPVGIGELQKAFEALYNRLLEEGLFAPERKRVIPRFPKTIGIVTSESGAALQDILTVLRRRYPVVRVVLRPASVQGIGSELEVARAIQEFNLLPEDSRPDVLIVGRGGGSLEDLWCFNEEAVARAIFASRIPVVSAVGHEVDVTIADFVADLRAPTPTAAAELATPDLAELYGAIEGAQHALTRVMRHQLQSLRRELEMIASPEVLARTVTGEIDFAKRDIERKRRDMQRTVHHTLERFKLTLERDDAKLRAMNPYQVLERGYAVVETPEGAVIPRLGALLEAGEKQGVLVFADGRVSVRFD